eukprot:m.27805 g.27805  ORF g.27805 m.27805 type:complete len:55 (-) comp15811_c1_seq1:357-521(-)
MSRPLNSCTDCFLVTPTATLQVISEVRLKVQDQQHDMLGVAVVVDLEINGERRR